MHRYKYTVLPFLTSALDEGEWSALRPGRFTPREIAPRIHWIGGWVGPRVGLDAVKKRKILLSPGMEPRPSSPSLFRPQTNVITKNKDGMKRVIVATGCGTHIVQNCVQTRRDTLPIEVEALMVKIYKCFRICADPDTELLRFCGEADTECKTLLQHDNSRVTSGDRKAYRSM
jgi:hypothetical protein